MRIDAVLNLWGKDSELHENGDFFINDPDKRKPTKAENILIDAEIERIEADIKANEYKWQRRQAYEALNQFELQYNDAMYGTNTWKEAIKAIKKQYPKTR